MVSSRHPSSFPEISPFFQGWYDFLANAPGLPPVVFQCRLQKLVSPVASQCGEVSIKFFHWCSSVPSNIRWVIQWYSTEHWVNHWHSSGIPVYSGPASVHWLRLRGSELGRFRGKCKWRHLHTFYSYPWSKMEGYEHGPMYLKVWRTQTQISCWKQFHYNDLSKYILLSLIGCGKCIFRSNYPGT